MSTGSLAYRQNAAAIWDGHVPEKYTRLLPYITGSRIMEIGAAEGVLALLVADRDPTAQITALELRPDRHADAMALQARWRTLGKRVDGCTMVCGDVRERILGNLDTVVAVRSIYYLKESIAAVFAAVSGCGVRKVVLSGNANRARRFAQGTQDNLGAFNFYASVEGMTQVLARAGYRIGVVIREGDPIVTGTR